MCYKKCYAFSFSSALIWVMQRPPKYDVIWCHWSNTCSNQIAILASWFILKLYIIWLRPPEPNKKQEQQNLWISYKKRKMGQEKVNWLKWTNAIYLKSLMFCLFRITQSCKLKSCIMLYKIKVILCIRNYDSENLNSKCWLNSILQDNAYFIKLKYTINKYFNIYIIF